MVLSEDRKTTHLIDSMVLESMNTSLSPVAEFTDFMSGEKYISISVINCLCDILREFCWKRKKMNLS